MRKLKTILLALLMAQIAHASTITTPNMDLVLPVPGTEPGPTWAQQLNTAFGLIDLHDHTTNKGVNVPSAGLNINTDLQFNDNDIVLPRSTMYVNHDSPLATGSDTNNVFVSGGNLYFNNDNGDHVQITDGDGLNFTASGLIGGMDGTTAAVTYSNLSKTFTFTQATGQTANISAGSIFIFENVVSANRVGLVSPSSLLSSYSLIFPTALPGSTQALTVSSGGQMATISYDGIGQGMTSTGADAIATTMTVTGANAIAADMNSTGANAIGAAMNSTGANAVAASTSSPNFGGTNTKSNGSSIAVWQAGDFGRTLKILHGFIKSDGTTLAGSGFSSSKLATGHYAITFTTAFTVGIPYATPVGANLSYKANLEPLPGDAPWTTGVEIWISDSSEASVDSNFTFLVVGY